MMKFAFCKHPSDDKRIEQEMSQLSTARDEEGWHLMTNERAVQVLGMVNCWVSSFTEAGNINKQRSRYTRENNEFLSDSINLK